MEGIDLMEPVISAASVIAATPIAVLFIFFQRQITGGLTAGSIKG